MVNGHVEVGDGLRLHSLRGVHHQKCAFAAGYAAGDFVGEVHVARSVDEVELVLSVSALVHHLYRVTLDCDALFLLQVHVVEYLILHVALRERTGKLEKPVGQRALAVVDVGYYAEIADVLHFIAKLHKFSGILLYSTIFAKFATLFLEEKLLFETNSFKS